MGLLKYFSPAFLELRVLWFGRASQKQPSLLACSEYWGAWSGGSIRYKSSCREPGMSEDEWMQWQVWNGHQRRGEPTAGVSEAREDHQLSEARFSYREIIAEHGALWGLPGGWQGRKIIFAADKKRGKLVSLLIFRLGLFATKIFQGRGEICLPSQLKTSQDSNAQCSPHPHKIRLSTSLTMHSWILCLLKQNSQFSSSWKDWKVSQTIKRATEMC